MMAPRQCQIHYIALYTLLFILTLLEKEKEAFALSLFFSLSLSLYRPRAFLALHFKLFTHISRGYSPVCAAVYRHAPGVADTH
jgi:hypothetical protein